MTTVGILGASGRMGRALVAAVAQEDNLALGAATLRPGHSALGEDAGTFVGVGALDVPLTEDRAGAAAAVDVLIDFTLPAALQQNLDAAIRAGTPVVIGTTGLDADAEAALNAAALQIPLVQAANYSSGVTLMRRLVELAAGALGDDYDVEILEAHHRLKKDAPSGTALALGEAIANARGVDLAEQAVRSRDGHPGERPVGAIGFQTLRGGDIVGEHTVMLAGQGERIELTHRASSRDTFARGALRAARWLVDQPPKRYDMEDVLGLHA